MPENENYHGSRIVNDKVFQKYVKKKTIYEQEYLLETSDFRLRKDNERYEVQLLSGLHPENKGQRSG